MQWLDLHTSQARLCILRLNSSFDLIEALKRFNADDLWCVLREQNICMHLCNYTHVSCGQNMIA